jgi:indolepyruvate decarboxylase
MGLDPIVIVLNNHGYLTERFILEGKFNDVQEWQFHKLPALFDSGEGFLVRTEGQLDDALTKALANKGKFSILNVMLDKMDSSPALRRLGESLANRVG